MKEDFSGLSSVARALTLLEDVGLSGGCSFTDLLERTKLPKSTLMRLIGSLVDLGFLQRTKHGYYAVSMKVWRIGCGAVEQVSIRESVVPVLRKIVEHTAETALCAVYEDGFAVYVEKLEGLHPIRRYASVGGRSPAYASATGKALLSWRSQLEVEDVAARATPLTDATLLGQDVVDECASIRHAGFAVNRGEWRDGVWSIAAPVFGPSRVVVAAIGVSGPRERVQAQIEPWSRYIREAARELSTTYGAADRAS